MFLFAVFAFIWYDCSCKPDEISHHFIKSCEIIQSKWWLLLWWLIDVCSYIENIQTVDFHWHPPLCPYDQFWKTKKENTIIYHCFYSFLTSPPQQCSHGKVFLFSEMFVLLVLNTFFKPIGHFNLHFILQSEIPTYSHKCVTLIAG